MKERTKGENGIWWQGHSLAGGILVIAIFLAGGFHEYISILLTAVCAAALIVRIRQNKEFTVCWNIQSITVTVLVASYLITTLYAIDRGMAWIGFLKWLAVLLYLFLLYQRTDERKHLIQKLPDIAVIVGLLSVLLYLLPVTRIYFSVAGRMSGFFEYPNTFAMFLLVGVLVLLTGESIQKKEIGKTVILLLMILLTGSRTVLVLTVCSGITLLFLRCQKRGRRNLILGLFVGLVLLAVLYPILNQHPVFGRLYAFSLNESTFVGRLLYVRDALALLRRYPFGTGYLGYYYLEQSVQTGVYSVRYLHNDFLQIFLDVGWIPGLLILAAFVKQLISAKTDGNRKIILLALFLHGLFDFDLQFAAMAMVVMLFLSEADGRTMHIRSGKAGIAMLGMTGLTALYMAAALGLSRFGFGDLSYALYPYDTENNVERMISRAETREQKEIADQILLQNEYVPIAYSAEARYAYSQGNFEEVIRYKHRLFEIAPFSYEEYEEYCYMLIQGIALYEQKGDAASAEILKRELLDAEKRVLAQKDRLSRLGRRIDDQPGTELPEEISGYLKGLERDSETIDKDVSLLIRDVSGTVIYDGGVEEAEQTTDSRYRAYLDVVKKEAEEILSGLDENPETVDSDSGETKEGEKGYVIDTYLDPDMIVKMEDTYVQSELSGIPFGCALTDLSGRLVGIYSSEDESGYNYAIVGYSPYSTLKPLAVYAPALEKRRIHWSTLYEDSPYKQVEDEGRMMDWPQNASGIYKNEPITVSEAIKDSVNTVAVKCLADFGVANSIAFLEDNFDPDLEFEKNRLQEEGEEEIIGNLAMGYLYQGITPIQMAGYYQIFANGGNYVRPQTIAKIKATDGTIIYERKVEARQVIDESTACIMNHLLQNVVNGGTATGARLSGIPAGGKTGTGTANDCHWFVGFVPEYCLAVWHGGEERENGSPEWFGSFFSKVQLDPAKDYPESADVVQQIYCLESGGLATPDCREIDVGYYFNTSLPDVCNRH